MYIVLYWSANMGVKVIPILCLTALISVVSGGLTFTPCRKDDVKCLAISKKNFISETSNGIPEYNIWPIDPVIMNDVYLQPKCEPELKLYFKNLFVTGFKDQQLLTYDMDTKKQDIVMTFDGDTNIFGDITIELGRTRRVFTGAFTLSGNVAGTIAFNYLLTKDFEGVSHYEIGPEKIVSQVFGKPKLLFSPELDAAIHADPEARAIRHKQLKTLEVRKEVLTMIADKLYSVYMHNLKEATRILPASSFIIN